MDWIDNNSPYKFAEKVKGSSPIPDNTFKIVLEHDSIYLNDQVIDPEEYGLEILEESESPVSYYINVHFGPSGTLRAQKMTFSRPADAVGNHEFEFSNNHLCWSEKNNYIFNDQFEYSWADGSILLTSSGGGMSYGVLSLLSNIGDTLGTTEIQVRNIVNAAIVWIIGIIRINVNKVY